MYDDDKTLAEGGSLKAAGFDRILDFEGRGGRIREPINHNFWFAERTNSYFVEMSCPKMLKIQCERYN